MFTSYFSFAGRNWRPLAFGSLLIALSSFGQTYYVSLFGAGFRHEFGLSDGGLGAMYAVGTMLSALTLTWAGRLIDHTSVRRYTLSVGALLTFACVLTAVAPFGLVLAVAFYFLRLGGQGLMVHTGITATARAFPTQSGKAIGMVMLGFSLAQAVFPPVAVFAIGAVGWRLTWLAGAVVVALGAGVAVLLLPRWEDKEGVSAESAPAERLRLWKDPRMMLTLPVILASPFIGTGFFFHQARLAEEKHWTLAWIAGWFVAYAIVQAGTNMIGGPIIDRVGPKRLLPFFLMPQAVAMLALAVTNSIWAAPVYLIFTGVTTAIGGTLATALWVELYGPALLARVRSSVEAGLVVASGASPVVMGYLIDLGVPLSVQAFGALVYILAASALSVRVATMASPRSLNV